MQSNLESCTIRLTKSRLEKGLLAIPKQHSHLFPSNKLEITVTFDDEITTELKSFVPDDGKSKEIRIFGLGQWFEKRAMKPGDSLTVTVLDKQKWHYHLVLDRYLQAQLERKARDALRVAPSDEIARAELQNLADVTRRSLQRTATATLQEIAKGSSFPPRSRASGSMKSQHAVVAPAMRILLGELHRGKCQICSFTFIKKDGSRFFEVHHIDPDVGDHPANLLVLCPNCHAQVEYAHVESFERIGGWLTAITINGQRMRIRQPLATEPLNHIDALLRILFLCAQSGFSVFSM